VGVIKYFRTRNLNLLFVPRLAQARFGSRKLIGIVGLIAPKDLGAILKIRLARVLGPIT